MPQNTPQKRSKPGAPRKRTKKADPSGDGRNAANQREQIHRSLRDHLAIIAVAVLISIATYLYNTHPIFERPRQDTKSSPFEVIDLPGKGKGLVAVRDIEQGELLLVEKPLFRVPRKVVHASPGAVILSLLASLSLAQRESFYNLSYVGLAEGLVPDTPRYNDELALAIFQTNAVAAGDLIGVFPRMARLNHGCSSAFNSVYTWREAEGVLVVHALKPIRRGEELLTTYIDTKRPRHDRREILHEHYGFMCECSVCLLPKALSQASDRRLIKIAELYSRFATWQSGTITGKEAVDTAREIWLVGEEEGYWSERGRLAADAAWVAAAHSDSQAVLEWTRLARQWYAYELGPDSESVREAEEIIARPMRHLVWGTREAETVGVPNVSSA